MPRAEDLFARLEAGGEKYLDELIATRKSEEAFLDFKRSANDGGTPRWHDHDRNHFAKALSGFSNSEGGVLVWGIDCSDRDGGGDVAKGKCCLADPSRFVAQLEAAVSGLTVPPVQGVRSIAIPSSNGGFAATLIPQSVNAPHQWVQEKRYYIRAGSSFEVVPHGVLAGLFGRHPRPHVFINFVAAPLEVTGAGVLIVRGHLMLVNGGSVVAEDLYVTLLCTAYGGTSASLTFSPGAPNFDRTSALGHDVAMMGRRDFRLPPGGLIIPLAYELKLTAAPTEGVRIRLRGGCRGAPPYQHDIAVSLAELQRLYVEAIERWRDPTSRKLVDWHKYATDMIGISSFASEAPST